MSEIDYSSDASVMESTSGRTFNWKCQFSRKLTAEEWDQIGKLIDDPEQNAFDARGDEYNLPMCLFLVRKVCPDVEAVKWEHAPIKVLVVSMGLPRKVYEIENAMSLKYAEDAAKKAWKADYSYMGMRATIISTRLATKRDLKGMM